MGIETKYYTNANEPKSLGLASAAVGQIPKIKAVDSNGVPTEWEATAMPSGGAGTLVSSDALNPIILTTNDAFHKKGDICSITSPTATEILDAFNRCDSAFYLRENKPNGMLQPLLYGGTSSTFGSDHEIVFKELCAPGTRIEMRKLLWQSKNNTLTLQTIIEFQSQYKAGKGISISNDNTISVTAATYYTGTADPVNTLGADGDLYLKTEG